MARRRGQAKQGSRSEPATVAGGSRRGGAPACEPVRAGTARENEGQGGLSGARAERRRRPFVAQGKGEVDHHGVGGGSRGGARPGRTAPEGSWGADGETTVVARRAPQEEDLVLVNYYRFRFSFYEK